MTLAIVGGYGWYLAGKPNLLEKLNSSTATKEEPATSRGRNRRSKPKREASEKVPENFAIDGPSSSSTTGAQERSNAASKKRKINTQAPRGEATFDPNITSGSDRDEEGLDAKNFASAMAQARSGTSLKPSSQAGKTKQSNSRLIPSPSLSAAASSTTGADADDDRSPSVSPLLRPHNAGGVADMLEAPAAPAGVLRITGEAPAPKAARSSPKPIEPTESKKQRQARKKREEQKARAEEAEKLRLQLRDQQLRTARMAAGNSNQQKSDSFTRAQPNAWSTQKETGIGSSNVLHEPLDTFDEPAKNSPINGATPKATEEPKALTSAPVQKQESKSTTPAWASSALSEEEQLRQLQQQELDNTWNTVSSKKSKKGKQTGSEKDSSEASVVEPSRPTTTTVNPPAVSSSRPQPTGTNSFSALNQPFESEMKDSDWQA